MIRKFLPRIRRKRGFATEARLARDPSSEKPRVVFSGIQPTGDAPHLGNYLGALKNWENQQHSPNIAKLLYCVVDLHAITGFTASRGSKDSVNNINDGLRQRSRATAAALLACGIDPAKSVVFVQSDVKEHAELAWTLGCFTPMGHLNRMTQFKQKSGGDRAKAPLGLFSYPVLQAADILLYKATDVPVGDDQRQHIELCRDIAGRFNHYVGRDVLVEPNSLIGLEREENNTDCKNITTHRVASLRNGLKKMSKSDISTASRIDLTDSADEIAFKIRRAKTDTIEGPLTYDLDKRPEVSNLVGIYAGLTGEPIDTVLSRFEMNYENSNSGGRMSLLKEELTEVLVDQIVPIGDEMRRWLSDVNALDSLLQDGADEAREIACNTMSSVREALEME